MKVYVGHTDALRFLREDFKMRFVRDPYPRVGLADDVPRNAEELQSVDLSCVGVPSGAVPSLVVPDGRHRFMRERFDYWVYGNDSLPDGAFLQVFPDVCVASPEFVFLQMANELPIEKLIQLGFELCGFFTAPLGRRMLQNDMSLTTVEKLGEFLSKVRGIHGVTNAKRALRYIRNGSGSPMEAVLVMKLCLPRNLGGYSMPWPELNFEIRLKGRAERMAGKGSYVLDLYWPDAHLDVEYDSEQEHTGASRIARDANRRNVLKYIGISQITVTPYQFLDFENSEALALQVAKAIGFRIRPLRAGQFQSRLNLHKLLLDRESFCI